jgi:hypothetical protein
MVDAALPRYTGTPSAADRHPFVMASQLYAAGLREDAALLRFMMFWPACEAMDVPLRKTLDRHPKDQHWGLKALAERRGESASLIRDAKKLRNELFHVQPGIDIAALPDRAKVLGDGLERILPWGLLELLGVPIGDVEIPARCATSDSVRVELTGTLVGDPARWSEASHPGIEAKFDVVTGAVTASRFPISCSLKLTNLDDLTVGVWETWGPRSPNPGTIDVNLLGEQPLGPQAPRAGGAASGS